MSSIVLLAFFWRILGIELIKDGVLSILAFWLWFDKVWWWSFDQSLLKLWSWRLCSERRWHLLKWERTLNSRSRIFGCLHVRCLTKLVGCIHRRFDIRLIRQSTVASFADFPFVLSYSLRLRSLFDMTGCWLWLNSLSLLNFYERLCKLINLLHKNFPALLQLNDFFEKASWFFFRVCVRQLFGNFK
jgi:hypothetical protein